MFEISACPWLGLFPGRVQLDFHIGKGKSKDLLVVEEREVEDLNLSIVSLKPGQLQVKCRHYVMLMVVPLVVDRIGARCFRSHFVWGQL